MERTSNVAGRVHGYGGRSRLTPMATLVLCALIGLTGIGCKPGDSTEQPPQHAPTKTSPQKHAPARASDDPDPPPKQTFKTLETELRNKITELGAKLNSDSPDAGMLLERGRLRMRLRHLAPIREKPVLDLQAREDFEQVLVSDDESLRTRALTELARLSLRVYDVPGAITHVDRALQITPNDPIALAVRAYATALSTDEWTPVIEQLEQLVSSEQHRNSADIWLMLGNAYQFADRDVDAERMYRKVLQASPEHVMVWSNLALALQSQGRSDEAAEAHRIAQEATQGDLYAVVNQSNALVGSGDREQARQAVDLLHEAVRIAPGLPAAWLNLGNAYVKLEDYEQAVMAYERVTTLVPQYADAWDNMAIAYMEWNKNAEAISCLETALKIAPGTERYLYHLGNAQLRAEKYDDARITYQQITARGTTDPRVWNNLGNVLLELQLIDEAERAYHEALRLNPRHAYALNGLGLVALRFGDPQTAKVQFEAALALDPANPTHLENLKVALVRIGDASLARESMTLALEKSGQSIVALAGRGALHFHFREFTETLADFRQVIAQDPEYAVAFRFSALSLWQLGQTDRAARYFRRGRELDPASEYGYLIEWVFRLRHDGLSSANEVFRDMPPSDQSDRWQVKLTNFVQGLLDEEALVGTAVSADQQCEAYFYVAEKVRATSGFESARPWYDKCVRTGIEEFVEFRLAHWALDK